MNVLRMLTAVGILAGFFVAFLAPAPPEIISSGSCASTSTGGASTSTSTGGAAASTSTSTGGAAASTSTSTGGAAASTSTGGASTSTSTGGAAASTSTSTGGAAASTSTSTGGAAAAPKEGYEDTTRGLFVASEIYSTSNNPGTPMMDQTNMRDFVTTVYEAYLTGRFSDLSYLFFSDKATVKTFSEKKFTEQRNAINGGNWSNYSQVQLVDYTMNENFNWTLYAKSGTQSVAGASVSVVGDPSNEFVQSFKINVKSGAIELAAFLLHGKMYIYTIGKAELPAAAKGTAPADKLQNLKNVSLTPPMLPSSGINIGEIVPPAGYKVDFPFERKSDYQKFGDVDAQLLGKALFNQVLWYVKDADPAKNHQVSHADFAKLMLYDINWSDTTAAGSATAEQKDYVQKYITTQNTNIENTRTGMKKFTVYDTKGTPWDLCVDIGDGGCGGVTSVDVEYLWTILDNGANLKTFYKYDQTNEEFFNAQIVYQITSHMTPATGTATTSTTSTVMKSDRDRYQASFPVRIMKIRDRYYVRDIGVGGTISQPSKYVHTDFINDSMRYLAEVTRPMFIDPSMVSTVPAIDYSDVVAIRNPISRNLIEHEYAFRFPKRAQRLYDHYHYVTDFFAQRWEKLGDTSGQ